MPRISSVLRRYWTCRTCCCMDICRCGCTSVIKEAAKDAPAAALTPLPVCSCVWCCNKLLICEDSCLFCRTICDNAVLADDVVAAGGRGRGAVEYSIPSDSKMSSPTWIGSMLDRSALASGGWSLPSPRSAPGSAVEV